MASSLDITPALGHGLVAAQGQPGGYDAIDDRRFWSIGKQEGALDALAYKVTETAAAPNLGVTVNTGNGHYLVKGDDVSYQGLYLVSATALDADLDLADPPDVTNPRVDYVVLEARDDAHTGDGVTRARVYVLSGTPTAGADVVDSAAYNASKPVLPDSTALLAEFVVDANATSITNADIRDRRTWALGAFNQVARTGGDLVRPAGAGMNWLASTFAPRVEFSGAPVRVTVTGTLSIDNTGDRADFELWNGTVKMPGTGLRRCYRPTSGDSDQGVCLVWEFVPTPGSYLPRLAAAAPAGAITLRATAGAPLTITVEETVRALADNA